jgi:hypothetical protein
MQLDPPLQIRAARAAGAERRRGQLFDSKVIQIRDVRVSMTIGRAFRHATPQRANIGNPGAAAAQHRRGRCRPAGRLICRSHLAEQKHRRDRADQSRPCAGYRKPCARFKGPICVVAARAPYFHNGMAKDLEKPRVLQHTSIGPREGINRPGRVPAHQSSERRTCASSRRFTPVSAVAYHAGVVERAPRAAPAFVEMPTDELKSGPSPLRHRHVRDGHRHVEGAVNRPARTCSGVDLLSERGQCCGPVHCRHDNKRSARNATAPNAAPWGSSRA